MTNSQLVPNRPDVKIENNMVVFPAHEATINGKPIFFKERRMGCAPSSETLAHIASFAAFGHKNGSRT